MNNDEINSLSDLKKMKVDIGTYQMRIEDFLDSKRFILQPDFQRGYVWDDLRASLLIETILLGLPIPAIYTYITLESGDEPVIDGQQRLKTIKRFTQNAFPLKGLPRLPFLNGLTYFELQKEYKNLINQYEIQITSLKNITSKQVIYDVFRRFNTGGLKLNAQEIRNCIYGGQYNDFIKELAKNGGFRKLMEKYNTKRFLCEELTVRFFTMYDKLDKYKGSMNSLMNEHYEDRSSLNDLNKLEFKKCVKFHENKFLDCINACEIVFGQFAFRNIEILDKPMNGKKYAYGGFSKLVFDMQMLGFADVDLAGINRYSAEIKERYIDLMIKSPDMVPNTKNNNKLTAQRIKKWQDIIKNIVNE